MKPSDALIDFLKGWEELRLAAYDDGGGVWTIGYGHTAGVKPGDTCTEAQADRWLVDDASEAAFIVDENVVPALTQNEADGLAAFVMNVGRGRPAKDGDPGRDGFVVLRSGRPSTMLRRLNEGNFYAAAEEFPKWNRQGNRVLAGLTKRRNAERAIFESADYRGRP